MVYEYPNARAAKWPAADFVVGNPPFVGNKRMRMVLGDGYVEALRAAHDDVPESVDFVMYWWNHAAKVVRAGSARRFGLITTNSITQSYGRKVVQRLLTGGGSVVFAIADHPWVDSESGAAVRIAMTVGAQGSFVGTLVDVHAETHDAGDAIAVRLVAASGRIGANLQIGAGSWEPHSLKANVGVSFMGVTLGGAGFELTAAEREDIVRREAPTASLIRPYVIGKNITQRDDGDFVLDTFGLSESELREVHPVAYTRLLELVRPARQQMARPAYRDKWWIFAEARSGMRHALQGLPRFIATCRTAKHRTFTFLARGTVPESTIIAIAVDDAQRLAVLSSRVHLAFALAVGGTLEDRPRYNNSLCFEPFPFPSPRASEQARLAELAERLDAHRKRQLAAHPKLTITGMYNVLEKLRANQELTPKDREIQEQGFVTILKQIHDDLDAAVFDAYGWAPAPGESDLTDEQILEKLVALNAERAAEEAGGFIRWLRPEFQAPVAPKAVQVIIGGISTPSSPPPGIPSAEKRAWPKLPAEQVAALRDLITAYGEAATFSAADLAAQFKSKSKTPPNDIEQILDALATFGVLLPLATATGRRFARPTRAAA